MPDQNVQMLQGSNYPAKTTFFSHLTDFNDFHVYKASVSKAYLLVSFSLFQYIRYSLTFFLAQITALKMLHSSVCPRPPFLDIFHDLSHTYLIDAFQFFLVHRVRLATFPNLDNAFCKMRKGSAPPGKNPGFPQFYRLLPF